MDEAHEGRKAKVCVWTKRPKGARKNDFSFSEGEREGKTLFSKRVSPRESGAHAFRAQEKGLTAGRRYDNIIKP